ncbi:thioesterase family protein [Halobacillus halophilus]|uniref:thioesterase family protein n=1 Tax=Halobacillus halophilus TaxID=1570 RepID=UPI001CD3B454|nr:thioesterase family protein [Halobacillus halophilus]MCA1010560.1 thioesterase family protein [Halobacillus halophilus]
MKPSFRYTKSVPADWVDYNGHMNDAEYSRAFSLATDAFIKHIGLDPAARKQWNYTIFTLETHTCYLQEVKEKAAFEITAKILDYDSKRMHMFFTMKNESGELVATFEEMLMGINQTEGRGAPFPESVAAAIRGIYQAQDNEEYIKQAGRTIGIRKK